MNKNNDIVPDIKFVLRNPEKPLYDIVPRSGELKYVSSIDFKLDDSELEVEIKPFNEEKNWSYDS